MFDLVLVKNIVVIIVDVIIGIQAIKKILNFKKFWTKVGSILLLLITLLWIILLFNFVENGDTFKTDLYLSVYKPLVINHDGTKPDDYLVNANYRVLCAIPYPKETRFKLVIKNLKTWVKREYDITDVSVEKNIGTLTQGKYMIKLYKDGKLIQKDTIALHYDNTEKEEDGKWHFSIFTTNGFYDEAISRKIIIGADNCKRIDDWDFSVHADQDCEANIFSTNIVDSVGTFEGDFYFIPGRYYLNNEAEQKKMDEIIINIR